MPLTTAVPTVVPPAVQVVGALACGPKTMKVIVPVELAPELEANTELMEPAVIAVPAVPAPGPVAVTVGDASATTVSDMAEPQVETAVLLFPSPP